MVVAWVVVGVVSEIVEVVASHYSYYAHIEVLVTFLLVNLFGFWVIARYPTMRF